MSYLVTTLACIAPASTAEIATATARPGGARVPALIVTSLQCFGRTSGDAKSLSIHGELDSLLGVSDTEIANSILLELRG